MGLQLCPDCMKWVSENTTVCPNCGCPKSLFPPNPIFCPNPSYPAHRDEQKLQIPVVVAADEHKPANPPRNWYKLAAALLFAFCYGVEAWRGLHGGRLNNTVEDWIVITIAAFAWSAPAFIVAIFAHGYYKPFYKVLTVGLLCSSVPFSVISGFGHKHSMELEQERSVAEAHESRTLIPVDFDPFADNEEVSAEQKHMSEVASGRPDYREAVDSGILAKWIATKDPATRNGLNQTFLTGNREQFAQMMDRLLAELDVDSLGAIHKQAIFKAHPDYVEIFSSGKLSRWIEGKKGSDKEKLLRIKDKGSTKAVIDMFSRYKRETGNR
jgi:hypothetical protein